MQRPSIRSKILTSLDIRPALAILWQSGPGWALASTMLLVLQGLLPLASLYLLKLIIDAVEGGVRLGGGVTAWRPVLVLVVLAGGIALLGALLQAAASYVSEAQGFLVADHMMSRLHEQSARVDQAFYEDPRYHDTLHLAQQQTLHRPKQILDALTQILQNGLSLAAMAGLLFLFHWTVPLVLLAAALPGLWVRLRHADLIYRWHLEQAPEERRARYFSHVLTSAEHAKELRLFGLAGLFVERFDALKDFLRRQMVDLARRRSLAELVAQVSGIVAIFGALAFIAWRTLQGTIGLGDLVMYFQAFQRGQGFLRAMMQSVASLYGNNLFLSSFDQFLALEPTVTGPIAPSPTPRPIRQGITFEGVGFTYPGSERYALDHIDLRLEPGETVALVGENGAGKSTLVKLLCRLYDPTTGRIMVDGTDLRALDVDSWRRQIAVVFQDYSRYHLTARQNIWLGDTETPEDSPAIEDAARAAGVHEMLRRLPRGYDQPLGKWLEDGDELSIGQWQKIALARAFLRRAPITLLDEPTSALDAQTELEVIERFRHLTAGRTALLISHRLSTVRLADRILVLQAGRIVEEGHHRELMALKNGVYAQLFSSQARQYQD